jgi:hypothetical protein
MDNIGSSCHIASALRCLLSVRCVASRLRRLGARPDRCAADEAWRTTGTGPTEKQRESAPAAWWTGVLSGLLDALSREERDREGPDRESARADAARCFRAIASGLGTDRTLEDAHETMGAILERSGLEDLFTGSAVTEVRCEHCGAATRSEEPFTFLTSSDAGGTGDALPGICKALGDDAVAGYSCGACRAPRGSCTVSRRIGDFPAALALRCSWPSPRDSSSAPLALDLSLCAAKRGAVSGGSGGSKGSGGSGGSKGSPARVVYRMRSALVYQAAHYRAVAVSGDGTLAVVHDDGRSLVATPRYLAPGPSGACETLTVNRRSGQLHTAVYEKAVYRPPTAPPTAPSIGRDTDRRRLSG